MTFMIGLAPTASADHISFLRCGPLTNPQTENGGATMRCYVSASGLCCGGAIFFDTGDGASGYVQDGFADGEYVGDAEGTGTLSDSRPFSWARKNLGQSVQIDVTWSYSATGVYFVTWDNCCPSFFGSFSWLCVKQGSMETCAIGNLESGQLVSLPVLEMVHLNIVVPEVVYVTDTYTIAGYLWNNLPVPVLVNVELVPEEADVCSVEGYTSSGGGVQVGPHEYLVEGNNSNDIPEVWISDHKITDDVFADTIAIGATITATAVGQCRMEVVVSVKSAAAAVGVQSFETATRQDPPPPFAKLGGMEVHGGSCGDPEIVENPPPAPTLPMKVTAGMVDLYAQLDVIEKCSDPQDAALLSIDAWDGDSYEPVPGAQVQRVDPGPSQAHGVKELPAAIHAFQVRALYFEGYFDWDCTVALIELGIAGVLAIISALAITTVIGAAFFVVAMLVLILAAMSIGPACSSLGDVKEAAYELNVEAIDLGTASAVDLYADLGNEASSFVDSLEF